VRVPVRLNAATPGYLDAMRIPLLAGRDFDADDRTAGVALVNRTFARVLGLGEMPLGARFHMDGLDTPIEVVGLIPDSKYFNLREDALPIVFVPKGALPDPRSFTDYVVRTRSSSVSVGDAARAGLAELDPSIRADARSLERSVDGTLTRERLVAALSGAFGLLAAIVAAVGLYGALSCSVSERTRELALRVALGASRRTIVRMVWVHTGIALAGGLALGAAIALPIGTYARPLLFGLDPLDPWSALVTIAVFGAVAAVACSVPTLRALRLEPRRALTEG
jgi:ABC-type antimicrobial peptide transport system permease subunit